MTHELITNRNLSLGLQELFIYVNDVTGGLFINLLLFVIWASVTFGMYFAMKRTTTNPDFASCLATGGFVTGIIATLLFIIPHMLNTITFIIVIVLMTVSVMFYMFNRNE